MERSGLASPGIATALAVLVLLLAAAAMLLTVLAHQAVLANVTQLPAGLPLIAVGLIIARRQPGNPIGWLLLAFSAGVLRGLNGQAAGAVALTGC